MIIWIFIQKMTKMNNEISHIEQSYEELFKSVSELNEDNVIIRSNCKFCHHPIRHEAEKRWEEVSCSFSPVKKLFAEWEQKNENADYPKMSLQNIRSHLLHHYARQEQQMWLEEYTKSCKAYMTHKISQDKRFEMLRVVIEKQLYEVASNPTLDILKKSDHMVKLTKMLLEIDECQSRLRGELQPVNVVSERFQTVWLHIINNQDDDRVKNELIVALDKFKEHMQEGIVIN